MEDPADLINNQDCVMGSLVQCRCSRRPEPAGDVAAALVLLLSLLALHLGPLNQCNCQCFQYMNWVPLARLPARIAAGEAFSPVTMQNGAVLSYWCEKINDKAQLHLKAARNSRVRASLDKKPEWVTAWIFGLHRGCKRLERWKNTHVNMIGSVSSPNHLVKCHVFMLRRVREHKQI